MPNGRMFHHSCRLAMSRAERAAYTKSEAYAEHVWSGDRKQFQCPGSYEYYGPCRSEGEEEWDGEEEWEDEEDEEVEE